MVCTQVHSWRTTSLWYPRIIWIGTIVWREGKTPLKCSSRVSSTLLDGSREYTSMDNSRGPVRSDVSQDSVTDPLVFFHSRPTSQMPSNHWRSSLWMASKWWIKTQKKISLQRSHVTAWGWPEKWALVINPLKYNYLRTELVIPLILIN